MVAQRVCYDSDGKAGRCSASQEQSLWTQAIVAIIVLEFGATILLALVIKSFTGNWILDMTKPVNRRWMGGISIVCIVIILLYVRKEGLSGIGARQALAREERAELRMLERQSEYGQRFTPSGAKLLTNPAYRRQ